MRPRSTFMMALILIGILLLSPFFVKTNPAAASSVESEPIPSILYLPIVMRNFPVKTVFGVEMGQLTPGEGLDEIAAANISWVRRNAVLWSSVEPTESTRNWSSQAYLETELKDVSNRGFQVVLIVRSTPAWARKIAGTTPYCGPISATKLTAFGRFMHDLVARYSAAPYNVKYWELWNEPDIDPSVVPADSEYGCWGDQNDAYYGGGYYGEMLKTAYPQIKAADPQAQVLIGGLLLDCDPRPGAGCASVGRNNLPPKFLEGLLRNNGGPYFDGISFHAYDYYSGQLGTYGNLGWQSAWNTTGPVFIAKARFIENVLSEYGISGKFLMNTESAILCPACSNDPTYETTKAYYLVQAYATAIAQGLRANMWYSVMGWNNSGLLNSDLSPRPGYTALQFARSELRDATWTQDVTAYPGVKGYEFQRGDRRIWVIWSLDGMTHTIDLPAVPLAIWDGLGNSIAPTISINVDLNPLYLEWNP